MTTLRARLGSLALLLAGVLFVLYPALRPWHDESTVDGALASMSSTAWVVAHGCAMIGFILLPLGLLALWRLGQETPGEKVGLAAVVTAVVGGGLVLPYYGAEDFGLHALASAYAGGARFDLLDVVEHTRYNPFAITFFGAGLISLAISGVLMAVAIARAGRIWGGSGVLAAVGLVTFLPQFYTPPAIRIAHGVVLGIGLFWLGLALWRVRVAVGLASEGSTPAVAKTAHTVARERPTVR
jgi:hypothetical protein